MYPVVSCCGSCFNGVWYQWLYPVPPPGPWAAPGFWSSRPPVPLIRPVHPLPYMTPGVQMPLERTLLPPQCNVNVRPVQTSSVPGQHQQTISHPRVNRGNFTSKNVQRNVPKTNQDIVSKQSTTNNNQRKPPGTGAQKEPRNISFTREGTEESRATEKKPVEKQDIQSLSAGCTSRWVFVILGTPDKEGGDGASVRPSEDPGPKINKEVEWLIPRKISSEPLVGPLTPIHLRFEDVEFYRLLLRYVPSRRQLENLGFPMTSHENPKLAFIYKQGFHKSRKSRKREGEEICIRCGEHFSPLEKRYLKTEKCVYHWGKLCCTDDFEVKLSCCDGAPTSSGCSTSELHVWTGTTDGWNGPLSGFVRTQMGDKTMRHRIYGLDCEMCFTSAGTELVRVALVGLGGHKVYESLVKPEHAVVDYNTRFSNVSKEDFLTNRAKTLSQAQRDLLFFIKQDTILVGHSLDNDLRALKMVHNVVVDTSLVYPHEHGFPKRRSLKDIAKVVLDVSIHDEKVKGHDPIEDARICLALIVEKMKEEHNVRIIPKKTQNAQ